MVHDSNTWEEKVAWAKTIDLTNYRYETATEDQRNAYGILEINSLTNLSEDTLFGGLLLGMVLPVLGMIAVSISVLWIVMQFVR